jgi:hypothetical protein
MGGTGRNLRFPFRLALEVRSALGPAGRVGRANRQTGLQSNAVHLCSQKPRHLDGPPVRAAARRLDAPRL